MGFPDTRISLLQRLIDQQDTAAWTEFCIVYERAIYRIGLRYGLQDADAREVSQEVLLAVSRRIQYFDLAGSGRFRSWLGIVARNATVDVLRKNRHVCSGGVDTQHGLQHIVAEGQDPTSIFDWEARREQFRWAAEQVRVSFTDSTWQSFWRTAVEGQSAESVARELRISVGAVYVARCRVLAKIKALVEPFREDAS